MKGKATDENENEDEEGKGGGGRAKKHADVLDGKVRGFRLLVVIRSAGFVLVAVGGRGGCEVVGRRVGESLVRASCRATCQCIRPHNPCICGTDKKRKKGVIKKIQRRGRAGVGKKLERRRKGKERKGR